ncbi:UNVERIFIED_CONTAM: hypothetical protein Sindi_0712500 [Sesamum indicum]
MARCYQNAYEPKWEELCELFDEDEYFNIPVPDEEEEDDDDVLLPEIPNMAAFFQHDEPATVIFYPIFIDLSSSSDDENGTDLNVPKVLKDDGASSSNAAPPEEPPSKGK